MTIIRIIDKPAIFVFFIRSAIIIRRRRIFMITTSSWLLRRWSVWSPNRCDQPSPTSYNLFPIILLFVITFAPFDRIISPWRVSGGIFLVIFFLFPFLFTFLVQRHFPLDVVIHYNCTCRVFRCNNFVALAYIVNAKHIHIPFFTHDDCLLASVDDGNNNWLMEFHYFWVQIITSFGVSLDLFIFFFFFAAIRLGWFGA